jgi:TfoX/Sxy family transcriptional regulator of competence genes
MKKRLTSKGTSSRKPKAPSAKENPEVDPRFARVMAAFSGDRRVTSGKMMSSLGLKVDEKIFAMHVRGKFVAKLPKERVDELVEAGLGSAFDPRRDGRVMKEWIELRGDKPPWLELAREAHRFVGGKAR